MDQVQVLRDAADAIEKHGLIKGALHSPLNDRMCARGAVMFVRSGQASPGALFCDSPVSPWELFGDSQEEALMMEVASFLGLQKEFNWGSTVASWNNATERSQEEVVAAFRGTADVLELRKDLEVGLSTGSHVSA